MKILWRGIDSSKDAFHMINRHGRQKGVMLIELMVAMAMSAVVIVMIFWAWTLFIKQTSSVKRRTFFHAETERISRTIASSLRRSPKVLDIGRDEITFIDPNSKDTIHYSFYGDSLYRNDTAVVMLAQSARVTDFSIEQEQRDPASEADDILLTISIGMKDDFNDESSIKTEVKVIAPVEEEQGGMRFR
jgi:Tfp pilus assembly protein PilE